MAFPPRLARNLPALIVVLWGGHGPAADMGDGGSRNPAAVARRPAATATDLASLHEYIHKTWATLTRSHADLAAAAVDPKFPEHRGPWPVYVSRRENFQSVRAQLASVLSPAAMASIDLRRLPDKPGQVTEHGLLYLPRPYVVPGGRFNEMYGWDSYFIVRGLLRQGEVARARDLVDDAIYQVLNFGKLLNANRTYYLQRSQPPLLTEMIRSVFLATHDRAWLARALPAVRAQYHYFTAAPHLAGNTGLSRYRALGAGPAPEVEAGEQDEQGRSHYQRVQAALRREAETGTGGKHWQRYYDARHDRLTPLFYVADRSMRESGFDPSDRFGQFSLEIMDYAPVCLNSLLLVFEEHMADFLDEVRAVREAPRWRRLAARRQKLLQAFLWDGRRNLFVDYDFVRAQQRSYPFATTFFPLWAGAATPDQARQLAAAALSLLKAPGGLLTSTNASGKQWDAPFGWAPLQLIAVEGLRRYGLNQEADELSLSFMGTVLKEYVEHGKIFEKYDVQRREADVFPGLRFGYSSNEAGFGWTNGVFLELEAGLALSRDEDIVRAAGPH